jgi:hypothetical protein
MRQLRAMAAARNRGGPLDGRLLVLLHGAVLAMVSKKSGEEPLTPQQRITCVAFPPARAPVCRPQHARACDAG